MGYRYIDDIIEEHEKQKIQLENALASATLNSEIIDSISKLCWLIYRMDLVNSILDMNKLESGVIVLEEQSFNLVDVLEEVNNIAEMNATRKNLHLSVDHSQIKYCHLIGSPLHLKQILQNIDGNAVKYNREGGSISFFTEEISCLNGVATYKFVCSDTGCGMSREFLSHAFETFVQEDASARTAYMGTGLGLSIAKQLAEMMGGTIQAESEKGVGTTFTTTVSFKVDTAYDDETNAGNTAGNGSLEGLKVLLAEDNELNMEIAEFLLENVGMNVMTAVNGKEAIDIFGSSALNEKILLDTIRKYTLGRES